MRRHACAVIVAIAGAVAGLGALSGIAAASTTLPATPGTILVQASDDGDDSGNKGSDDRDPKDRRSGDHSSNDRRYGDHGDKTVGEALTGAPAGSERDAPAPPVEHR